MEAGVSEDHVVRELECDRRHWTSTIGQDLSPEPEVAVLEFFPGEGTWVGAEKSLIVFVRKGCRSVLVWIGLVVVDKGMVSESPVVVDEWVGMVRIANR